MEIILKTKQSGNPLFNFLGYTDSLNPYYKFLVQAIRSSSYKPAEDAPEEDLESNSHGLNTSHSKYDFSVFLNTCVVDFVFLFLL